MLIDKAAFPRDKVCAGWITPAVVDALELDLAAYGLEHVVQPIGAFRTGLIGGRQQQIAYPGTVSYGILRIEFDDYLLRRADVRLRLGEGVGSIVRRDGRWVINEAISAALVVGAGGHFCPVAHYLGATVGSEQPAVAAQKLEFRLSSCQMEECRIAAGVVEIFFCRDLKGYGWCLRKGDHLNIGLGREDSHRLSRHRQDFCAFLKDSGKLPADLPDDFKGHAYGLYGHARRQLVNDGMLLVGDAAGLAAPESGEGIRPAVESALLAAEVIGAAAGDYRRERLEGYATRLHARFGPPSFANASPLAATLRAGLGRILLNSRWFNRHVVLDRWFLHREPASRPAVLP